MSQTAVEDMTLTFSENLKVVRHDRGLSQRELAEKCGIPQGHICHFESARRQPLLHNLVRIAVALEVSTDILLGRNEAALVAGQPIPRFPEGTPPANGHPTIRNRSRGVRKANPTASRRRDR